MYRCLFVYVCVCVCMCHPDEDVESDVLFSCAFRRTPKILSDLKNDTILTCTHTHTHIILDLHTHTHIIHSIYTHTHIRIYTLHTRINKHDSRTLIHVMSLCKVLSHHLATIGYYTRETDRSATAIGHAAPPGWLHSQKRSLHSLAPPPTLHVPLYPYPFIRLSMILHPTRKIPIVTNTSPSRRICALACTQEFPTGGTRASRAPLVS